MISNKLFFISFIILFNIFAILFSVFLGYKINGLFFGSIVGMAFFFFPKDNFVLINNLFIFLLFLNLFVLINNLFFYDYFIVPPLFGSPDETYNKTIIRAINLFGNEFRFRRTTGISDNIHVTSLLNIILCYFLWIKKRNFLFYLSTFILFISLNIQFIIIFILWILIRNKKLKINLKLVFNVAIGLLILFFIIDYFFLGNAYYYQIISSGSDILLSELKTYLNAQSIKSVLFGIKPGDINDPYDSSQGYYLPLTDIGIIGIPIQFGLIGCFSIILISIFWFKYSSSREMKFIIPLFFSAIHYFSLISFLGILYLTWLVYFPPKEKLFIS
jgi:hypothetical protein